MKNSTEISMKSGDHGGITLARVGVPYAVISLTVLLFAASAVFLLTFIFSAMKKPVVITPRDITRTTVAKPVILDLKSEESEAEDPVIPPVYYPPMKRLFVREDPPAEDWIPNEEDVIALARCLWGECRGCSYIQKAAVCWCVFNRVDDSRFPDTVYGVVSQPSQFFGYQASFPVTDELYEIAYRCMVDWHNGENRIFDHEFIYFHGTGRINVFTTTYGGGGRVWEEE